jgi:hypothetical protein
VTEWPAVGDRVVVWTERTPSRTPRGPHEATVDHVAGRTFTVAGIDAVFNRSTGRSKPIKRDPKAYAADTFVAVDAASERAQQVLGHAELQDRTAAATRAVTAWLADHSAENRRAAVEALKALDDT